MKRARVAFAGAIHEASQEGDRLRLADGRIVDEHSVVWLPPFQPRTVFAVGLNYSDHAKEISSKQQREPLIFLKNPSTIAGHRAQTRRPADAKYMHYECELAVVIGRSARQLSREYAYTCVAGYTVANDYAIPGLPGKFLPTQFSDQKQRWVYPAWSLACGCWRCGEPRQPLTENHSEWQSYPGR